MKIQIVTDSVADLPPDVVESLDITVVPLTIRFGDTEYRDGVDLGAVEFYRMLQEHEEFPVTSVPSAASFAQAFDLLSPKAAGILVITLSSALSGTYDAARQAREITRASCPVDVMDSEWAAMPEGFVVMEAARAAAGGASMDEVMARARATMARVGLLAAFDSLEYLKKGGRIGAARALLGSVLKINPIIGLRDGLVYPAGRTRSRAQAMDRLYEYAASFRTIDELAVESTACDEDAERLTERLGALYPREKILRTRMTPVIGAHTGPGLLVVAARGDRGGATEGS